MTAGTYVVQVVAPSGKVPNWGTYSNRDEAEQVARQLRIHGFYAQVRVAAPAILPPAAAKGDR